MSEFDGEHDELKDHLSETFPPTSIEGFLGKEHFWATGQEAGMTTKMAGIIFDRLVYPVRDQKPLKPSILGLVVRSRREVGMPLPPPSNTGLKTSGYNRKHYHRDALGPREAVVQARGIILLEGREDLGELIDGVAGQVGKNIEMFAWTLRTLMNSPEL